MNTQSNQARPSLLFLLSFLAAGASVFALWQHKSITHLRAENRTLQQATNELERLRRENAQIDHWRSVGEEVEKLRKDNLELNRLRNEIRQLRAQAPELEQLRTENQRLQMASQQLLSQKKEAENQLAQVSADHAASLALKAQADSAKCVKNLKQIVLAGRLWAEDHNDAFPPDIVSMSQVLLNPGVLICPSDLDRAAAASWQQFQASNTSYKLVSPGAQTEDPNKVFVQCTVHGHIALANGRVQESRPAQ